MIIKLEIMYDQDSDVCQVRGFPIGIKPDGRKVVHRGVCFAALEQAKQAIMAFDPEQEESRPALVVPVIKPFGGAN